MAGLRTRGRAGDTRARRTLAPLAPVFAGADFDYADEVEREHEALAGGESRRRRGSPGADPAAAPGRFGPVAAAQTGAAAPAERIRRGAPSAPDRAPPARGAVARRRGAAAASAITARISPSRPDLVSVQPAGDEATLAVRGEVDSRVEIVWPGHVAVLGVHAERAGGVLRARIAR